jgi:lipopolysaccharide/colanic/teichoic acid biosynthesis glycosyltransferase
MAVPSSTLLRLEVEAACRPLPVEERPVQRRLKRALDVGFAAVSLIALAPLLLVVAALVRLTSRGPVLFRQERVGHGGRPFVMLKFRSMIDGADAQKAALALHNERRGPVFKMRADPRVTSLGRFLRKYSVDELPQLINVLLGDMSLVGPRPPLANEVARYERWQMRRLSVPPGLTCLWQVAPDRCEMAFDDWVRLDLRYIDGWHLGRDLALILKTVPAVLSGKGQW